MTHGTYRGMPVSRLNTISVMVSHCDTCLWPTGCGQNQFDPVWLWGSLPLVGSSNGPPRSRTWGFWPNFKANWLLIWITPGCQGLIPFLKINTLKRSCTLTNGYSMCVFVHHDTHALTHKQLLIAWLSIVIVFSPTRQASCSVVYDSGVVLMESFYIWGYLTLFQYDCHCCFPSPSCFNCLPQINPYHNYSFFAKILSSFTCNAFSWCFNLCCHKKINQLL